jgi:hypothetical protein
MRPVIRYQSQLLPRRSYKPNRFNRNRPVAEPNLLFGPVRAGPALSLYEYESYPVEFRRSGGALQNANDRG